MLRHYLVWTWRTLAADPLTTLLNLLALSLGLVTFALAAATALFLRSNDATLPNADRIYAVSQKITSSDGVLLSPVVPYTAGVVAKYVEADYSAGIEAVTLVHFARPSQVIAAGKAHMLSPQFFDDNFTRVIKLPLRYGDPEKAFSQPRSAILTAETAESLFGASNPVGQPLRIANVDVTISGVLAPVAAPSLFHATSYFHFDLLASRDVGDLVAPLTPEPDAWDGAEGFVLVLLPEGVSPDGLRGKLADFGARHVQRLKRTYEFGLVPLVDMQKASLDALLGAKATGLSIPSLLLGLGTLVLLVASLNYANLAAAKAVGRLPESGMKKVLGAGRLDLLAQYLTESLTLTIAAMALVLLILVLVAGPFLRLTDIDLHRQLFHRPVFWLVLLAGVAGATLLGGLYPAWLLSGPKAMAATLGGKVRQARSRLASVLVGLQFLGASFLLVMVGVVAVQNNAMHRLALPTDGTSLLAIDTALDKEAVTPQDVRNAVRDIPGVQAVAGVNLPLWTMGSAQRRYFKDAGVKGQAHKGVDMEITVDYFTVLGSHLLAGREFALDRGGDLKPDDDVPTESYNVVVDRDFAESFGWAPEQAVGQSVWHLTLTGGSAPVQIIGVIENQPQAILANGASGTVYTLMPAHGNIPIIRLAPGAGSDTLAAIDRALVKLSPQIDWHHHFSDEMFNESASMLNTLVAALSGLALFAVVIALLGLAGMAIHTTNSRTEEIGIRKILGADHFVILRLLAWDLTKPVLIASLASWPLAYIAGQIYLSMFTGHAALGPWPFVISLAATIAIAWLAVGWRIAVASAKSPAAVLRYE